MPMEVEVAQVSLFLTLEELCTTFSVSLKMIWKKILPGNEWFRDRLQILFLILDEFKRINEVSIPLKSSKNQGFSDDFRKNRNWLILLNLLNIRSEIWRRSLMTFHVIFVTNTTCQYLKTIEDKSIFQNKNKKKGKKEKIITKFLWTSACTHK